MGFEQLTNIFVSFISSRAQELFLSTPVEERLYVGKRKGFIKLAMRTGSEVVPCYYFGNTTVLEVRSC